MLSVNPIARVVVNTVRASASPTSFDTGLLLIRDSNYTDARRLETVTSSAAAIARLTAWGFAATSDPYKAAVKYFAASPSPSRLLLSCYPTSEIPAEALAAVLDRTASFYGVMLAQTDTDSQILSLYSYLSGLDLPLMLFVPITVTASAAVADGSLLDQLHDLEAKRAVPFYCASISDAAALMGTAMGLELSHKASAFSLCYKTISGVTPSSLTENQVSAIEYLGGNVYVTRGYSHLLLEKGSTASGGRYDEILYVDQIADALQNEAITLLAENPDKLPQTDDTTAQFINRFTSVLMGYADRRILASGIWRGSPAGPLETGDTVENGFVLWAGSYDDRSDKEDERRFGTETPNQTG